MTKLPGQRLKKWLRRYKTNYYKTKEILIDVVGSRVPGLVPANKAKTFYKCCCPFHIDRTPSFKLFQQKDTKTWHIKSFGCGWSGDVFKFLETYERWEPWKVFAYMRKDYVPSSQYPMRFPQRKGVYIQMKIPFPVDELGKFIWVSGKMTQLGFK